MKTSEALRACKPYLAKNKAELSHKDMYICFALEEAVGRYTAMSIQDKVIYPRLAPYSTAGGWLKGQGKDFRPDELQEWRHNWVDQLIEEFESIGR